MTVVFPERGGRASGRTFSGGDFESCMQRTLRTPPKIGIGRCK
jgi:hypothetical protein